jgi:Peptidase M10 serralysin C terminal
MRTLSKPLDLTDTNPDPLATDPTILVTSAAASSPFVINVTWDSSASSAPAAFKTGVLNAVQYLESQFSNAVTINIHVGYGEVNGQSLGSGALGESTSPLTSITYANLVTALKADATSAADSLAVASLPATSPITGTFLTTAAQAKALGLSSSAAVDGYVGFSNKATFTYDNTNGVTAGTYDFNGVVLHEISEVMGRLLLTGTVLGGSSHDYSTLDLFHWSSAGTRDFTATKAGYFSVDGGATNLAAFNTVSGGDAGDWASSVTNDAFDAFSSSGIKNTVSSADLTALDVIGWTRSASALTALPAPTGVIITDTTSKVAALQGTTGLTSKTAIATMTQTGGASGDSFTFGLSGAGASGFSIATAANTATLSTGSTTVAGATGGKLYALTVTAKDSLTGATAPAQAIDVIVGGGGADTVSVAAIVGNSNTGTPSFIYGLAGADHIDATGMTGKLWITGGAGGDTLTGGSGVNDYVYGATSDSPPSAMDIITNFHTSSDLIDLSAFSTGLTGFAALSGTSVAAKSVGWQTSGGNTFVYVNTSSASETLTTANMKVELMGSLTLSRGNFGTG